MGSLKGFAIGLSAMVGLMCLGCGGGSEKAVEKTHGLVTVDGKPLGVGVVIATPESGRAATAAINPDGTFSLSTYGDGDGAIVGSHRVTVTATGRRVPSKGASDSPDDVAIGGQTTSLIPLRYGDLAQSELVFDVVPNKTNEWNIQLDGK